MTDVTIALEAVGALIEERTKYEGWISALASKSDVPAHVIEKVRADYTSRLRTVLQGFSAHAPALDAASNDLQSRDGALAAQEMSCRDEHAEGELRHMVGEYDGEQWEKIRVGHEALLSRLASERQVLAGELASVQRSLAAAAEAAQRARSIGDSIGAPTSVRVESPTPAVQALMNEPIAPPPVIAMPEPVVPLQNVYGTPQSFPAPAERRVSPADDLGFLRTALRAPTPRESGLASEAAAAATATQTPEAPVLRIVPNTPAGSPVDAAKTLRCAECGTMNYATEWYCERCGGELAVL
jgi:hypothetical protein